MSNTSVTVEEIKGLPIEVLETKDSQVIADFLPPRVSIVATPIGIGTVLAVAGGEYLNALEAASAADADIKWSLELIKRGDFDVGHPVTRAKLFAFVQKFPELAAPISALLKLAEMSVKVDEFEVRKVCWSDTGEWLA